MTQTHPPRSQRDPLPMITPEERRAIYVFEGRRRIETFRVSEVTRLAHLAAMADLSTTQIGLVVGWAAYHHPAMDTGTIVERELRRIITARSGGQSYGNTEVAALLNG